MLSPGVLQLTFLEMSLGRDWGNCLKSFPFEAALLKGGKDTKNNG